jgi:hypothetical protein
VLQPQPAALRAQMRGDINEYVDRAEEFAFGSGWLRT